MQEKIMRHDPKWLMREVEGFSKETGELVSIQSIGNWTTEALQELLNQPPNEPLIDCFPIHEEAGRELGQLDTLAFDFENQEYFISAYATDSVRCKEDGGFIGQFPPPREFPDLPGLTRIKPRA